mmetsp:Transcript_5323/g.21777  ORF Transcript_5323/g.21777 Transcript_5323/m.21777 type:complete len:201 (-) Transcript_5323:211-813(-)
MVGQRGEYTPRGLAPRPGVQRGGCFHFSGDKRPGVHGARGIFSRREHQVRQRARREEAGARKVCIQGGIFAHTGRGIYRLRAAPGGKEALGQAVHQRREDRAIGKRAIGAIGCVHIFRRHVVRRHGCHQGVRPAMDCWASRFFQLLRRGHPTGVLALVRQPGHRCDGSCRWRYRGHDHTFRDHPGPRAEHGLDRRSDEGA